MSEFTEDRSYTRKALAGYVMHKPRWIYRELREMIAPSGRIFSVETEVVSALLRLGWLDPSAAVDNTVEFVECPI